MPVTAITVYVVNLALLDRVISDTVCPEISGRAKRSLKQAPQPASCSSKFTESKYINKCV